MRDNSWADELRTFNISEAAIANIKTILDAGYDVVHFDRDAELVEGDASLGLVIDDGRIRLTVTGFDAV
ncbi:hypothetical protein ACG755_004300 [Klebsiella variicola]|uniref:hypothetical protein n=1 Tax=Klebsiella variicola TaxID=244366 RepID=UPI0035271B1B